MPYRVVQLELSEPLDPILLSPEEDGVGLVVRWCGEIAGFEMHPASPGARLSPEMLIGRRTLQQVLALKARAQIHRRWPHDPVAPPPSLTIAICTKDRAARLERLLTSLDPVCEASPFAATEVLVVDNAPSDDGTRAVTDRFSRVRYLCEPKAGLDFARNAALSGAQGDLLAFLDDDVVVDRGWLDGLFEAWREAPDTGGFTGLVLPYRLDTPAQVRFEADGGFGRGFRRLEFRAARWGDRMYALGTGELGAGCNMCFDRALLQGLGGFDEALDTGAPLPGGGDLDIFYRVLRSGRAIVYEPRYAVYHEHRETLAQLRRQYWSWGLGLMAYLEKTRRADPSAGHKRARMVRWWLLETLGRLVQALRRGRARELGYSGAELWGGLMGLAGEYGRSLRRVQRIRERSA